VVVFDEISIPIEEKGGRFGHGPSQSRQISSASH